MSFHPECRTNRFRDIFLYESPLQAAHYLWIQRQTDVLLLLLLQES